MRFRRFIEGATDSVRNAARSTSKIIIGIASTAAAVGSPVVARLSELLRPWAALLRDLAALVATLIGSLIAKATDRFGVRATVVGAATAVFIGSTGGAAWAITAQDEPDVDRRANTAAAAELEFYEDAAAAAAAQIAEDREAAVKAERAEQAGPVELEPVGDLSKLQMTNAVAIIEAGEDKDLGKRAWAIALATAMQESKLRNYANVNVPESYDYDHQAEGSDHDSVGLFQQRPSSGWGSVEELMDPKTSASKFYGSLKKVDGWKDMDVTVAAQTVQVSAYPDAYAQWEGLAWDIVDAYQEAQ